MFDKEWKKRPAQDEILIPDMKKGKGAKAQKVVNEPSVKLLDENGKPLDENQEMK
jgi:hypothetical protein